MKFNQATSFLLQHGFLIVLLATFLLFSVSTAHFFQLENILNIFHAMAPLALASAGLGLVVISGRLDISIGSTAFLSAAVGAMLMRDAGVNPAIALVATLACGAALGAINGFIVTVLNVNSLITTLGTMIAYRGIELALTDALLVQLPDPIRVLGNASIGPFPADVLVMLVVVAGVHVLHTRTTFGRQLTAMGNDLATARKVGLPVGRTGFLSFVLSGVLASGGGILTTLQNGAVSPFVGDGLEFTALAVVVVGGISLLGGRGTIFLSILSGAFIFEMIDNGLTNLGASPYSYRLVSGVVIFAAMYADALKSGRVSRRRSLTT
jgi:ribose/xylose/arabinose/galactoside ABC-type transport system permease subunit